MKLTLRAWRKARGISADDLSKMLGVGRATLDRWESGRTNKIPIQSALKACEILQVTVDDVDFG